MPDDTYDIGRYSPEPPRPDSPVISEENDDTVAYNLREKTLEQHRLAQEEAARQAAELRRKQEEDLQGQKNQLASIENKAVEILSKYA